MDAGPRGEFTGVCKRAGLAEILTIYVQGAAGDARHSRPALMDTNNRGTLEALSAVFVCVLVAWVFWKHVSRWRSSVDVDMVTMVALCKRMVIARS